MANHKDILKQALNELPVGFAELLETAIIPAATEITSPASVEDALIACGKTAKYINKILENLGGLPLLQVPLRVGQLNPSTQILAVAGLEFVGTTLHEIEIVSPVEGVTYLVSSLTLGVQVTQGAETATSAFYWVTNHADMSSIDGPLTKEGADMFFATVPTTSPGQYSVKISVGFGVGENGEESYTVTKTVSVGVEDSDL